MDKAALQDERATRSGAGFHFVSAAAAGACASAERSRLILDVARMTDGAMLASKVVTVQ